MKRHSSNARARLNLAALAGWSCLISVICAGVAAAFVHSKTGVAVRGQTAASPRAASQPTVRSDPFWYFHSGQCQADARTLAEIIHFLLEPVPTNSSLQFQIDLGKPSCAVTHAGVYPALQTLARDSKPKSWGQSWGQSAGQVHGEPQ